MKKNDIVEELTRANTCLTDTVRILRGDDAKLISMLGLRQPTNAGAGGDEKRLGPGRVLLVAWIQGLLGSQQHQWQQPTSWT